MRWVCLLVVFAGCAAPRYERTNIEFKVEVLQDFYPKAYLSGNVSHESVR